MRRLVDEVLSATNRRCPIEFLLAEMPTKVQADERLLRHIFTNLLTNAVKYSDAGRVVQFEIVCAGADIVCTIRDQGIGIPEADREWLFNAFHRGRNVGDRPGTGLGLVIVKRCVDLHGGKIKVDSKLGEGTSVTLRLPIFSPESGACRRLGKPAVKRSAHRPKGLSRNRNTHANMKKILVIEDEPEMRRNLTTILRLEKFHPLPAENGRVGVELAKKEKPDLILCDVMMPELDGYGVIAALRADAATVAIPFIFLTAKGEKPDIRAGMNLGADDYLTKPVAKADLLAAIHSRLERAVQQAVPEFKPNFHSARPLEEVFGLTPRVAETLLWLAQGKTNGEIAIILSNSESTVKKHVLEIFDKLGVETRTAASLRALEVLSSPAAHR